MNRKTLLVLMAALLATASLIAQTARPPNERTRPPGFDGPPDGPPPFGPDGPPPFGPDDGPGRFGPPMGDRAEKKLVQDFDRNGNKRLDADERKAAREFLAKEKAEGRGPRRFGPRGGREGNSEAPQPGARVSPADVKRTVTHRSTMPGRCARCSSSSRTRIGKRSWRTSTTPTWKCRPI